MIEEKVRDLLEEAISKAGYILDEVTYEKEGKTYTLTLVIDKEGFININDCLAVNKIVNPLLDDADLISDSYVLDVCSKEKGSE
ncbi:MAG: hypothetical protein HFH47_00345 [Bacilli bacterium]|nr:hypothetical protein [Bacilli bacterium]